MAAGALDHVPTSASPSSLGCPEAPRDCLPWSAGPPCLPQALLQHGTVFGGALSLPPDVDSSAASERCSIWAVSTCLYLPRCQAQSPLSPDRVPGGSWCWCPPCVRQSDVGGPPLSPCPSPPCCPRVTSTLSTGCHRTRTHRTSDSPVLTPGSLAKLRWAQPGARARGHPPCES